MKAKKQSQKDAKFSLLRKEAELSIAGKKLPAKNEATESEMKALFQELQIHQIELEMQNDELRHANELLEIERLRFSGIYDLAPVGYFVLDSFGKVEDVNITGLNLLDALKSKIIGQRLHKFVDSADMDIFQLFLNKLLLRTHVSQSCRVKMKAEAGRLIDAQVEGITIKNTFTGNKQCYIAVIDITARVTSEQKLFETKNRLQLALEASKAGTWEFDLESGKLILDDATFEICGILASDFDGRYLTFLSYVHPDDQSVMDNGLRSAVNRETELNVQCRIVKDEQVCFIAIRGHVIVEQGKKRRFLGTMTDVTEKMALEEEANQLKIEQHKKIADAVLQTEENERKRISESLHDSVSQLLYGIKLNLQQLKGNADEQTLATINSLLNDAVNETRNISFQLAPSVLTDFGLHATIDELAKRLSTPKLQIRCKITGFTNRLNSTMELLVFRLIQELLNNCIKHSRASNVWVDIKKNSMLDIEVKDNGVGFDVNSQERSPSGSGLSSICNRLDFYKGTMHIDSTPGRGTSVVINLKL